jgi:hypothetical protein
MPISPESFLADLPHIPAYSLGNHYTSKYICHIRGCYPIINRLVKSDAALVINSIGAPILFMLLISFMNHTTPKKFWGMEKAGTVPVWDSFIWPFALVAEHGSQVAFVRHLFR